MSGEHQGHHGIGADDPLGLLARAPQRSPLRELRDYPFFPPEGDRPAPSRAIRHSGAWLAALALAIAIEGIVLGLLLR